MRRYLLDSAVVAAYLNGRTAAVNLVSPWIASEEAATSILVYGEIVVTTDSDSSRVPGLKAKVLDLKS